MDTIKNRNNRDIVYVEEIQKKWKKKNTQNCTKEGEKKKVLKELDQYDGAVSHLEPDILEREVKWTSGSTAASKASGCDGISAELFKTLKDDATTCCSHYVSKSGDSAVATGQEKVNPHSNFQEEQY